ncbi:MAG: hypothetical protein KJ950_10615 [Proteobacteria bacterium]|nr:hypothetical protein [Pseudomonadota bacterium]MBU1687484.1 hypothetical protein [Pseudomonadota bacterium]
MTIRILFLLFTALLASCGGGGSSSSTISPALTGAGQWAEEEGALFEEVTSTCTLTDGNEYRMFLMGRSEFQVAVSTDGRSFPQTQSTGMIRGSALSATASIKNPAVIKRADTTYLMIYEGEDNSGVKRFFRATSTDGVAFTPVAGPLESGSVMVPNNEENKFISVPDLLQANGQLHLYYVGNGNGIHHAVSADEGITWTRSGPITIAGLGTDDRFVDPDVIILSDGRIRLFFAYSLRDEPFGRRGIRTAFSTDGETFTLENDTPISTEGTENKLDPDVVERIDQPGYYRVYFGYSADGTNSFDLHTALSPE